MSETKLLPCPLCGKGFRKNRINAYEHDNEECILHGLEISNEKLLKQWNTRKPMERIVERLKLKLKNICGSYNYETPILEKPSCKVAFNNGIRDAIEIVKEVGGSCD